MRNSNEPMKKSSRPALPQGDIEALERLHGSYHGYAVGLPTIEADQTILRVVKMTLKHQKQALHPA